MTNEELVAKVQRGEDVKAAMEQLYQQNIPLITQVAKKYAKHISVRSYDERTGDDNTIEELMQEAYFALDHAAKNYKDMDCTFLTYFLIALDRSLRRYLNENCYTIRIPDAQKASMARYGEFIQEFVKTAGRYPSDNEMQAMLEVSASRVKAYKAHRRVQDIVSINEPVETEEGTSDIVELISYDVSPFTSHEDIIAKIATEQIAADLWQVVDALPDPYNMILKLYYQQDMNFRQISDVLGMYHQRVHEKHDKALKMLRTNNTIRSMAASLSISDAYSGGLNGSGLAAFRRTGTSSTERTVIKHLENEAWARNRSRRPKVTTK